MSLYLISPLALPVYLQSMALNYDKNFSFTNFPSETLRGCQENFNFYFLLFSVYTTSSFLRPLPLHIAEHYETLVISFNKEKWLSRKALVKISHRITSSSHPSHSHIACWRHDIKNFIVKFFLLVPNIQNWLQQIKKSDWILLTVEFDKF